MCVPHNCIEFCKECRVDTVSDLLAKYDLFNLLSGNCKAPDHFVLSANFSFMGNVGPHESTLLSCRDPALENSGRERLPGESVDSKIHSGAAVT